MLTTMIVDDDPIHIKTAQSLLEGIGVKSFVLASDGHTAENSLESNPAVDLILLDLNMPKYDGVEFIDFLREKKCQTPIILVTGARGYVVRGAERLAEAFGLKIVGTVEKPLTLKKLTPALSHI